MKFAPGITVVTPTIPPRSAQLMRATISIGRNVNYWREVAALRDLPPITPVADASSRQFTIEHTAVLDGARLGAAKTRQIGLRDVETEWVAFLDDDDEMLPHHLATLYAAAVEHQADYLWSRFVIIYPDGTTLDGPAFLGEKAFSQWNDDDPCQTTITTLVRTELALAAGGFAQFEDDGSLIDGHRRGEDFEFTTRCRAAGGVFRHVPEVTWRWHHWGEGKAGTPGNTSGMPDRW